MLRHCLIAICLCTVPAMVGCGSSEFETASVTGTVTSGGQPVDAGTIVFTPVASGDNNLVGKPATGYIRSGGFFTLSTYGNEDGAVVGTHKVTVQGVEGQIEEGEREPSGGTNPGTTTESFEVVAGEDNVFSIDLTPPQPKKKRRRGDDEDDD